MRRPGKSAGAQSERACRKKNPEFEITGVLVGALGGFVFGLVAELITGRGMIVMQAGGLAGALLGAAIEGVRLWIRKRR